MSDDQIAEIAEYADMIVNGYAFTLEPNRVRVLNLNNPDHAAVLAKNGDVVETDMDDIELRIVRDYYLRNKSLLEE